MARARHLQGLPIGVDDRVQQCHHAALLALEHEAVHPLQDHGGPQSLQGIGAQGALQVGHPRRRLDAAADHVSDRDPELAAAQRDRVIPVPADPGLGAPGPIASRQSQAGHHGQARQKASLQGLGDLPLDLDALRRPLQRLQRRAEDRVALAGFPRASRPLVARGRRLRVRRCPRGGFFSLRIHHPRCECNPAISRPPTMGDASAGTANRPGANPDHHACLQRKSRPRAAKTCINWKKVR